MPTPKTSIFTEFEFSNEELYAATRFTHLQLMLLQSLIAQTAQERLQVVHSLAEGIEKAKAVEHEICLRGTQEAYEYLFMLGTESTVPQAGTEKDAADLGTASNAVQKVTPSSTVTLHPERK